MFDRFKVADVEVDLAARVVAGAEGSVRLTVKALAVLEALIDARGSVVSRDALLEVAWAGRVVGEEVLTQAMAELRRAFGDDFRSPRFFQTVHKRGYRLIPRPEPVLGHLDPAPQSFGVEAYSDYLQAMALFEYDDHHKIASAVALLQGVLDECPRHAPSHAYLAIFRLFTALYYGGGDATRVEAARDAKRALELDPRGPEALTATAFVESVDGNVDRAMQHFAAAISSDARSAEAHRLLGRALFVLRDFRRAALMLNRVAQLHPGQYHALLLSAKALMGAGRPGEAMACLRTGRSELERHPQLQDQGLQARSDLLYFQLGLGEVDTALDGIANWDRRHDRQLFYPATGLARAGLLNESIECLERCVAAGWSHHAWMESDPDLQPLQRMPRFRRLKADVRGLLATA